MKYDTVILYREDLRPATSQKPIDTISVTDFKSAIGIIFSAGDVIFVDDNKHRKILKKRIAMGI